MRSCCLSSQFITGIGMTYYPHAGVIAQYPAQACCSFGCTVCYDHHAGMDAVAHTYPAAMMQASRPSPPTISRTGRPSSRPISHAAS